MAEPLVFDAIERTVTFDSDVFHGLLEVDGPLSPQDTEDADE